MRMHFGIQMHLNSFKKQVRKMSHSMLSLFKCLWKKSRDMLKDVMSSYKKLIRYVELYVENLLSLKNFKHRRNFTNPWL